LRSFDRIAHTRGIIDQEQKSGVDTVKADIAFDLDLNGIDRIRNGKVTVSSLQNGDPLDSVAHGKAGVAKASKLNQLSDIFSWDDKTDNHEKYLKLNQVLSQFESAISEPKISESVAEHGMMTGQNVFDQKWKGDEKEAVKNYVTEELYIHTKVFLLFVFINSSL
jgi:hypothetical protein